MAELKFPEWQRALQEAVLECDDERLSCKIQDAERLISLRFLQLQRQQDCLEERQALTDALYLLRLLKRSHGANRERNLGSQNCLPKFPEAHDTRRSN